MNQTNTLPTKDGPAETLRSSGWFASFFKRKPKPQPLELPATPESQEPPKPDWWPKWEAVMEAYPPGRRFEYLGRQMVVKWQRHYWPMFDWPFALPIYPAIIAEYADEHGVIHEHRFENSPWNLLPANDHDEPRPFAAVGSGTWLGF